jgi:fatty acid synthase subunit alpha
LAIWGNEFYKNNPKISPIRGALSVFGLDVDAINVASFHGTSTTANDLNETHVLDMQLQHLGRTKGNAVPAVMQKYLTGHPKGAAAAWMFNGVLQVLDSGIIPGNRNADNIDEKLKEFEHVYFPSRSLQTDGVKAGLLKSFGFGQVGGEALLIHPDFLLATLDENEYTRYCAKREKRQEQAYRHLHDALAGVAPFVQVKTAPPYSDEDSAAVYLNPNARATFNTKQQKWSISAKPTNGAHNPQKPPTEKSGSSKKVAAASPVSQDDPESVAMSKVLIKMSMSQVTAEDKGVGVDIELLSALNLDNDTFLERNFTEAEQRYCFSTPDPRSSFTGRWSAKEAVLKAISNACPPDSPQLWKGAGAGLKDIEILPSENGSPAVNFHGDAAKIIEKVGIKSVKVSISHSGAYAMAMAYAK